jgi:hypothetical protein
MFILHTWVGLHFGRFFHKLIWSPWRDSLIFRPKRKLLSSRNKLLWHSNEKFRHSSFLWVPRVLPEPEGSKINFWVHKKWIDRFVGIPVSEERNNLKVAFKWNSTKWSVLYLHWTTMKASSYKLRKKRKKKLIYKHRLFQPMYFISNFQCFANNQCKTFNQTSSRYFWLKIVKLKGLKTANINRKSDSECFLNNPNIYIYKTNWTNQRYVQYGPGLVLEEIC